MTFLCLMEGGAERPTDRWSFFRLFRKIKREQNLPADLTYEEYHSLNAATNGDVEKN